MENKLPKGTLGGQAVIEGVMMKGTDSYSVAIRKPDKKIEVKLHKYQSFGDKHAWAKIPFIRGVVNFTESMVVGMKTLSYSSSFYEEEEEETKADKLIKEVFKEKAESVIMGLTVLLSVILAIALFMMLPALIGEFIGKWLDNRLLLSLIEGIIRLVIFIVYVVLISQMEDIRRVFMYHGAEHKTINCYESGDELTPENVAKHSRYHKRCGTSFLFIVMVVSIVVFMFITADQMWLRFILRLLLIPVVAGISYEFIKLAGRTDNAVMNILSKPGMWIQRLTTKEPEEEMIQVAIISVESVLYGKPYVNAVNEAQGLGKAAKKAEKEVKVEDSSTVENNKESVAVSAMHDDADVAVEEHEDLGSFISVTDVDLTEQYEEYEEVIEEIIYEEEVSEEVQEEIEEAIEMITEDESTQEADEAVNVDDTVVQVVEEFVEVTEPVTEVDDDVVEVTEPMVETVDEVVEVTEPVEETVEEVVKVAETVEEAVEAVVAITEPAVESVEEVKEATDIEVASETKEAAETIGKVTKDQTTAATKTATNNMSKSKNSKKRNSKKGKK